MNVEPAPFSWPSPFVQRYVNGAADAGAAEPVETDAAADAATLGALEAGAVDDDGASVPPLHPVAPMAASKLSATRRLLTWVFTGDCLLHGTVMEPGLSAARILAPNVAGLGHSFDAVATVAARDERSFPPRLTSR